MAEAWTRRCRPLLGTFVEIAAIGVDAAAIESAFAAIARVHAAMSFHEDTSDLARLRSAGIGQAIEVAEDTIVVLQTAIDLHRRSSGLFDVAIGGALVAHGLLPRPSGTAGETSTGTAADIEIVGPRHVRCHASMLIDLGGIAKGYAVDRAADVLIAAGATQAIVNAGGDLRVVGSQPQRVHLRGIGGMPAAGLDVADAALASSGGVDGAAHHFDRHRRPVRTREPVTVIADRCIVADAMTKVALADPLLAARMLAELCGAIVARPRWRVAA